MSFSELIGQLDQDASRARENAQRTAEHERQILSLGGTMQDIERSNLSHPTAYAQAQQYIADRWFQYLDQPVLRNGKVDIEDGIGKSGTMVGNATTMGFACKYWWPDGSVRMTIVQGKADVVTPEPGRVVQNAESHLRSFATQVMDAAFRDYGNQLAALRTRFAGDQRYIALTVGSYHYVVFADGDVFYYPWGFTGFNGSFNGPGGRILSIPCRVPSVSGGPVHTSDQFLIVLAQAAHALRNEDWNDPALRPFPPLGQMEMGRSWYLDLGPLPNFDPNAVSVRIVN